jgi:sterol desaturase/sphingolipid hydroxylase (fatty acid hydroxylase superfamily)
MVITDKSLVITFAIPVFFLLILIEYIYGKYVGKNTYRLNDTFTSISIGMISRYPTMLNLGFQSAVFIYISSNLNLNMLSNLNPVTWILAFLMYDLSYYWMHRMHHEIKFLWATHSVHHHGEDFNLSTALRQTSTGWLWKWVFYLPMVLIGIPGEVFVTVAGINLVYQFWVHTKHIGHLGFLEKIFITPMNHGIHHAKNKEYIDANYGGVFIIWDRIFGTYTAELPDVKPVYGTVSALKSWNPIWANFQVFSTMLNDSIKTKKWSDKAKVWFSKTYWRPEDCIEEKGAKDFHVKFNPVVTTDVQVFSFFQLIFTIAVSGSVLFFISEYTKTEIAIIGVFIISLTTLTSMLLQSHNAYIALFILSCLGAVGITSFEIIDYEVLSSKLLVAQFGISAFGIAVIALYKRLFGVELANA